MLINGERIGKTLNVNVSSSREEQRLTLNVRRGNGEVNKARFLVDKFEKLGYGDAEKCLGFFIKCFRWLPENVVWEAFEGATNNPEIKSGIRYFIGICRNQLRAVGR